MNPSQPAAIESLPSIADVVSLMNAERRVWLLTGWSVGLWGVAEWLAAGSASSDALEPQLLRFGAAVLAALPLLARLLCDQELASTERSADRLVLLAVLGALATGEYLTAVLIPVVMNLGHLIEQRSIQGGREAIEGLQRLQLRSATVLENGLERICEPTALSPGQMLLVRPGERLAADGTVAIGDGIVDESTITGESRPRVIGSGDQVYAGSGLLDGLLRVRVTRAGDRTAIGRIRAMLSEALQSKAPISHILDRFAEFYIPAVLVLSILVLLQSGDWSRVIGIFVVSCPCGLVLSAPAAMTAALAHAVRLGILVKNARFLEGLADANAVIFDKTGTLTEGVLGVVRMLPSAHVDEQRLLRAAWRCARASRHPVSTAIVTHTAESQLVPELSYPEQFREIPGVGIEIDQDAVPYRLGRADWIAPGLDLPQHHGPLVGVEQEGVFLGWICLQDRIRPEAPSAIAELRRLGIGRIVLLTGDRDSVAQAVGRALAVDAICSEALPQDKLARVAAETAAGHRVLVVGDGLNDALALANASVGIAFSERGAEVALLSADIAVLSNDLCRIPAAVELARRTRSIIRQNVALALGTTGVMLAVSAGGLLPPVWGAVWHHLGTALVLLNSSRLLSVGSKSSTVSGGLPVESGTEPTMNLERPGV